MKTNSIPPSFREQGLIAIGRFDMFPTSMTRPPQTESDRRLERVLARVRRRQLDTALEGHFRESAHYAQLAQRIRRSFGQAVSQVNVA